MSDSAVIPSGWKNVTAGHILTRVSDPVVVDPCQTYQEIGIFSHGRGLFDKAPVLGHALGDKRVFRVKADCFVLNIVFAWEQAVARTTNRDVGKIASHRFPMYRVNNGIADLDYLVCFFRTKQGKNLLELASPGGAGRNRTLGQEEFARLPLCLPPVAEQRRMAGLLAAWDDAIGTIAALIVAKQQRFRWLYEELIASREHDRSAGWHAAPLSEVANIRFSGVDKKTIGGERPVRLCNYVDVFKNRTITADFPFMEATATENEIATFSLRAGDVLFTKDSETSEEIAESAFVAEPLEGVLCGYHLALARPKPQTIDGEFLALALRHPRVRSEFSKRANGVTRFGLTLDAMDEIEVFFPAFAQQRSIAAALRHVEQEIELLERQLQPLRAQKNGLMQKLLSGEWRLSDEPFAQEALARAVS
jgi:type I restriction enzyme, S subunit